MFNGNIVILHNITLFILDVSVEFYPPRGRFDLVNLVDVLAFLRFSFDFSFVTLTCGAFGADRCLFYKVALVLIKLFDCSCVMLHYIYANRSVGGVALILNDLFNFGISGFLLLRGDVYIDKQFRPDCYSVYKFLEMFKDWFLLSSGYSETHTKSCCSLTDVILLHQRFNYSVVSIMQMFYSFKRLYIFRLKSFFFVSKCQLLDWFVPGVLLFGKFAFVKICLSCCVYIPFIVKQILCCNFKMSRRLMLLYNVYKVYEFANFEFCRVQFYLINKFCSFVKLLYIFNLNLTSLYYNL